MLQFRDAASNRLDKPGIGTHGNRPVPGPADQRSADWLAVAMDPELRRLAPQEERLLRLRFGLGGPPRSLQNTATIMKLSVRAAGSLERRALWKLRRMAMAPAAIDVTGWDEV